MRLSSQIQSIWIEEPFPINWREQNHFWYWVNFANCLYDVQQYHMLSVHGVLLSHILQNAAFSVDCTSTFLQCGTYYIFIIHPTNTKYGLLCTHQGVDYTLFGLLCTKCVICVYSVNKTEFLCTIFTYSVYTSIQYKPIWYTFHRTRCTLSR